MTTKSKENKEVRPWVAKRFGDAALWVEHAKGATPGIPDCFLILGDRIVPLELKWGGVTFDLKHGVRWKMALRPQQRAVMRRILEQGGTYFVLVGDQNYSDWTEVRLVIFKGEPRPFMNGQMLESVPIKNGAELRDELLKHIC